MRPSVTYSSLTFSSGQTLSFSKDDVVVLVGPNNAGKSQALRELLVNLQSPEPRPVIRSSAFERSGTLEDLIEEMARAPFIETGPNGDTQYRGFGFSVYERNLRQHWTSSALDSLAGYFVSHIPTERRIVGSNQDESGDLASSPPQNAMQVLYGDDAATSKVSSYFKRAYRQDLVLDKGSGRLIGFRVGANPPFEQGENPVSTTYLKRLRSHTTPLISQGDGMRSFVTILLGLIATDGPTVLLLDEPEAFLHPPQARLLGEVIAQEHGARRQMFIASHSGDFLQGLLASVPNNLRIIRIERVGDVNEVRELNRVDAAQIASDPLLRFSNVLQGVFHRRVIVCESDADCLFYSSLLHLPAVRGSSHPDVLFTQAAGKHRMAKLAAAVRKLGVPVDVIADIDLLSEEPAMQSIVDALGGAWSDYSAEWQAVKTSIEQHRPFLNSREVKNAIASIVTEAPDTGEFPRTLKRSIDDIFRKASPWDSVREAGGAAIAPGEATQRYNHLVASLQAIGLWLVPVGEMEGFCRSIGGHGPNWVQALLDARDLASDHELRGARDFVSQIWRSGPD